MRILRLLTILTLTASLALAAHAQTTISPADDKAIDAAINGVGDSLTAMDFEKFATYFTDDADWINIVGMHWSGKAQILKGHRAVFTTRYKHVPQHVIDKSESLIAPNTALVITTNTMDDYTAQDGKLMTNNLFRLSWVLVKRDGKWLVRSGQNTIIDPIAAQHDPAK